MGVNKKSLAFAIASVMAAGSAFAVNLDATPPAGSVYASEINVSASGTALTNAAPALDVGAQFGFTIGKGTSKYVRFDLAGGAKFGVPLAIGDFTVTSASVAGVSISAGGQAGSSFVVLEVAADNINDILQTDTITFSPVGAGKITVFSQAPQTVKYAMYEFASQALNEQSPLVSKSGPYLSFAPAAVISCTAANSAKIDPANPKDFSPTATTTTLYNFIANVQVPTPLNTLSATVTPAMLWGTVTVKTSGAFTAFDAVPAGAVPTLGGNNTSVATDKASASITSGAGGTYGAVGAPAGFVVTRDQTDAMVPSPYTVGVTLTPGGLFTLAAKDLGTCGSLVYQGSTDRADFALTPGGFYKQYLRVTNPSSVAGDVTVQVWNDSGATSSFPLKNVTGAASSSLAGQTSTALLTIEQVYAAAQAANPAFTANGGKLRVEVRGNFGTNAVDNNNATLSTSRLNNGIVLQTFTTATDNTSFIMLKQ